MAFVDIKLIESFYDSGVLKNRSYYLDDGTLHRLDGPAFEAYYEDGSVDMKGWYRNGKLHRLDGPALYSLWRGGNVHRIDYYINGKNYTKEEFDEYVKGLESREDKELLGDLGQSFD